MHPYRMQQLIRERGKDQVVNVRQRASVYQAIERLQRDGLIEVRETQRDENWPERTVSTLAPSASIWSSTACRAPEPIATMVITEATPMMIPSIVSAARSL